jgi:autonomous glycyl radical cofactor GrcA
MLASPGCDGLPENVLVQTASSITCHARSKNSSERQGKTDSCGQKYQNLMVRVSGYSAYFVDLTKEVQDEIIARTEHCSA